MAVKHKAVFGIYKTVAEAETAVSHLIASGFDGDDISALVPDRTSTNQFAHEKSTYEKNRAPEGTAAGAALGEAIDGSLGLLSGIGALAIPGAGPFIAAGPIMGTLAGLGTGGTVGGLIGALVGLGIPEFEAKRYEGWIKQGGILLAAHCGTMEQVEDAKFVLKRTHAENISTTGEARADYPMTPHRPVSRA